MKTSVSVLCASLLLATAASAQLQGFSGSTDRKCTRVAYFDLSAMSSPGQYNIQYGAPEWKDDYEGMADKLKGKQARLGKDFWTTLDSSMDLTIGGQKVAAGYYYLGISRAENGDWSLLLFPADKVQKLHGDAFVTERMKGMGTAIPLTYSKSEKKAMTMSIEFTADEKNLGNATLTLAWGNHSLTAPVVAEMKKDAAGKAKPENADGAKKGGGEHGKK